MFLPLCLVCINFISVFGLDSPLTGIGDGEIRGRFWKSRNGRTFSGFTGIPYAKPPVGYLRFQAPVPYPPWRGIFNATESHVQCIQRDVFSRQTEIYGEEDCLYLNVYTPKVEHFESDLLPVLVFIHGGGFSTGSGNSQGLPPDILLDNDIVLVTMNYRIGPLGFLSTGDSLVPGNNGLKDQNLALKWVQKNIRSFGGDAKKITLFGYSAGSASVQFHMLSPLSQGLFQRAILAGGTAVCPWAVGDSNDVVEASKKIAKALKCSTEPRKSMVECLRNVDAKDIIDQTKIFMQWDYDPIIPFKPTIESDIEGAFLTDYPANLMKAGKSMDIPVLIGFNKDEGAMKVAGYKNLGLLDEFVERFDDLAPLSVMYGKNKNVTEKMTKAIRKFYFNDKKMNESIGDIINLYTDSWILRGHDQFASLFRKYYTQPLYNLLFAYRGSLSVTVALNGGDTDYGVCHGDNMLYVFPTGQNLQPGWKPTESDENVGQFYLSLLINFIINGKPTPHTPGLNSLNWIPYTAENEEYLEISSPDHIGMKKRVFQNRTEFWRNLRKQQMN